MKNIFIVQYYTSNVAHGPFAEKINKKYATENGYGYYCEKSNEIIQDYLSGAAPTWFKSGLVLKVFEKFDPDYVLFLDTDAIISDTNIRIEDFIDENYDFIAAQDVSAHSLMNAGVFLIKNNDWSINLMKSWFECSKTLKPIDCSLRLEVSSHDLIVPGFYSQRLWMDQTALTYLYKDRTEFSSKIKIIPNRSFNWSRYNDNNFIFHAYEYSNLKYRSLDRIYNQIFDIEEYFDSTSLVSLAGKYNTDKHYTHDFLSNVYQSEFIKIRETAKKVVELGFSESIMIWKEFFTNATIIGIDCHNFGDFFFNQNSNMVYTQLNIGLDSDIENFADINREIDIFIDDGSHTMRDQQKVFAKIFKSLKSGGLYILEDLHTSLSVKSDPNSIWSSNTKTTTLDLLEEFQKTSEIHSDFITLDEKLYLENNIESCEIFKLKPDWSYTSIIKKK